MRFDIENQLSVAQAFTAIAVSTNSYAKQTAAQDISIGRRMCIAVFPTVAANCTTVTVEVIAATDAALTTSITVLASASVLAADLALGKVFALDIPQNMVAKQYLGARITPVGGAATLTADIYLMPSDEVAVYKDFPKVVNAAV